MVAANYMYLDVRSREEHGLHGGAALANVHLPSDALCAAACDQSNAFTSVEVPEWMWAWQAVPPLRAGLVWDALPWELRDRVCPGTWIYPMWKRLVMGGSHSVHILMNINMTCGGRTLIRSCGLRRGVSEEDFDVDEGGKFSGRSDEVWAADQDFRKSRDLNDQVTNPGTGYTGESWVRKVTEVKSSGVKVFVVMHLFAGPRRPGDVEEWLGVLAAQRGLELLVLSCDLAQDPLWDLTLPETFQKLWGLVVLGHIDAILGGPPCSTWSRARFVKLLGGPRPLRFRGKYGCGRPEAELTGPERARVQESNVLSLNFLALCEGVSSRGGVHIHEHPEDPGEEPYPSIYSTELTCAMEERTSAVRVSLDQCMYGGPARKATTLSGTADGLLEGECRCDGNHQHQRSTGRMRVENGRQGFYATALAAYPSGLSEFLASCVARSFVRMLREEREKGTVVPQRPLAARLSQWPRPSSQEGERGFHVLNEKSARMQNTTLIKGDLGFYLHIDDGLMMSDGADFVGSERAADFFMHRAADELVNIGFKVTDRRESWELDKIVGYEVQSSPARLRLPTRKAAVLYEAMLFLESRAWVSLEAASSLLGLWVWAALLARHWLSAPQRIFRFAHQDEGLPGRLRFRKWWPSALREIVLATDAEGSNGLDCGGLGMVATALPDRGVQRLWEAGAKPGFALTRMGHERKVLQKGSGALVPTLPVSAIPKDFWELSRCWVPVAAGRWKWEEHITVSEMRSVILMLERVVVVEGFFRCKLISFEDNMPVAFAIAKGRSSAGPLDFPLRRRCALCAAAEIRLLLPWVETWRMPADWVSRCKTWQEVLEGAHQELQDQARTDRTIQN
ncbi:unnamed protein product [Prorocentrum cordatum]|uniref:Uncharacterized protein n=1 Tax=Prorocentrum cordatum TaxID=2364126 RepID=A0ABN9QTB0_9DINO|nr:unnamed protein product [Polarella glacialis]